MSGMGIIIVPWAERCCECIGRERYVTGLKVDDYDDICKYTVGFTGYLDKKCLYHHKPDWCPNRPLPQKQCYIRPDGSRTPFTDEYVDGWNAAIDAVMGGRRAGE